MERREFLISTSMVAIALASGATAYGQARQVTPELTTLAERKELMLVRREAIALSEGTRRGVRISESAGEGLALIPGTEFSNGTLEIDLRGKDVAQRSFIGVAFHGADGTAHDAVYFRPFNFRAADPVSHRHAVQYHSMPAYSWQKLRAEQPDRFEAAVDPSPDPNGWFRARIVVADPLVSVFVQDATTPCLQVPLLGERKSGLVGLWVGNNSGGDFANLVISAA